MYCKQCGKEIDSDSKYCSYCGTKQSNKVALSESQASSPNPNPVPPNHNVSISYVKPNKELSINEKVVIEKYDESYKGDQQASIIGIIIFVIGLIIYLTVRFENEADLAFVAVISLIARIIITKFVVDIAKRQNRDSIGWGILAFLFPLPTLIIIGFLKKLLKPSFGTESSAMRPPILHEESPINYDYSKITYIIKEIRRNENFFIGNRDILTVEFSDGKVGDVFAYTNGEYYHFTSLEKAKIYFSSKESAISGLHYYLSTNKISKINRTN